MSNKYKVQCPACQTDEFITYDGGTHAGGFDGRVSHSGNYLCDKCKGEFSINYEMKDDVIQSIDIKYKKYRKVHSGLCVTRA